MLHFNRENEHLFELLIQIKLDKSYSNVYPSDYVLVDSITDKLHSFCFPFASNEFATLESTTCINYFKDPREQNPSNAKGFFLFCKYIKTQEENITVSCLVSKFIYPHVFFTILGIYSNDNSSPLINLYFNATFIKNQYDIEIKDGAKNNLPVYKELTEEAQIAYFHHFFTSHFSPEMISLLILYLFLDKQIIVYSSSFYTLTHTVFSIVSFLYPLSVDFQISPMPPFREAQITTESKPLIMGIHTSMIHYIFSNRDSSKDLVFLNADQPYIYDAGETEFTDEIYQEMDNLGSDIRSLGSFTSPGFPAPFLLKRIQAYFPLLIAAVFKIPANFDRKELEKQLSKRKIADKKIDSVFAKSYLMRVLLAQSNDKNPKTVNAFWKDVTGEIVKFKGTSSLSIRQVPVPIKKEQQEDDKKKKGKKKK